MLSSCERGVYQPATDGDEDDSLPPLCKKRKLLLSEEEGGAFCLPTTRPEGERMLQMRKQYLA